MALNMKATLLAAALAFGLSAALPAAAQPASYYHIDPVSGAKVAVSVDDGTHPLPTSGGGGGGGGGAVTIADGAAVNLGAFADAACATDNGSCSISALLKRGNQRASSIIGALGSPFQAGGSIGNTTFASTQSGTWTDDASAASGSAAPSKVKAVGGQSGANTQALPIPDTAPFLNMTTATTTKIVTGVAAKKTYISELDFYAAGTTNAKLVTGTGTNCGTGTADLTPSYNFTAQGGLVKGDGLGVILPPVAASTDICAVSSAAVNLSVQVAVTQF